MQSWAGRGWGELRPMWSASKRARRTLQKVQQSHQPWFLPLAVYVIVLVSYSYHWCLPSGFVSIWNMKCLGPELKLKHYFTKPRPHFFYQESRRIYSQWFMIMIHDSWSWFMMAIFFRIVRINQQESCIPFRVRQSNLEEITCDLWLDLTYSFRVPWANSGLAWTVWHSGSAPAPLRFPRLQPTQLWKWVDWQMDVMCWNEFHWTELFSFGLFVCLFGWSTIW